jgi:sedoheptulokinase
MPFGGWLFVGASLCGGWSYAYLRRFYQDVAREMTGREVTDAEAYGRLNQLAARAPAGAAGLRADTRFGGVRGGPDVRGAVAGIDTANFTPANLARAVVEGMVGELVRLAGLAERARPGRIVATGNAARRIPLVREAIERAFSARCAVRRGREETALGAACSAAVGLGFVSTDEVTRAVAGEDA